MKQELSVHEYEIEADQITSIRKSSFSSHAIQIRLKGLKSESVEEIVLSQDHRFMLEFLKRISMEIDLEDILGQFDFNKIQSYVKKIEESAH